MSDQNKEILEYLENYIDTVVDSLEINPTVQAAFNEEEEVFEVDVRGDRLSFLIGSRGDTLDGLQHLMALAVFNNFGDWKHIRVDINSYRAKRQEKLEEIAKSHIDRVRFFSKEVALPPMQPYERKLIHEFLSGYGDVESFSVGEGPERHIIIKPASL